MKTKRLMIGVAIALATAGLASCTTIEKGNSDGSSSKPSDSNITVPSTPGTEETPSTPGTEETPSTPGTEETPSTPGTEETPSTPGTEETPSAPGTEETPSAPGTEETPSTPGTEETPSTPGTEETPSAPGTEETPSAPGTEETPSTPGTEETPSAPGTEETPSAPGTEEKPSTPGTEETPSAPGTEETPSTPGTEETPSTPGTEETPGAPGTEETDKPSTPSIDQGESELVVLEAAGHLESVYAEFGYVNGATAYNVYIKKEGSSDYIKVDGKLLRKYKSYYRVDVVGLTAGNYTLKICPVINGAEDEGTIISNLQVKAHDRSGFAFVMGTGAVTKVTTNTSSGAYKDDGSLKSNAIVVYVSNNNKNSVKATINGVECVGLQNIINGAKKQNTPLCVRLIGNITDPSVLDKGDLVIDGITCGFTLEGIGEDATVNGWGVRIKNSSNVEIRNIGFMNCNSSEGDNLGIQQGADHIWIHNCDLFYGDAGSDADQVKGDGALDTKKSSYITHSYNHFWDNGKCNLQGMKSETTTNYITYHHNWYDHSDSRHPRIRTCTVHIYNNYFDGNAKYGVGMTMGGSAFVENNYFRSTATMKPMLISMQGTDAQGAGTFSGENGGIIKAFNNTFDGKVSFITQKDSATSFDAYVVSSRDEKVPSTVKALKGGTTYNNFDTDSSLMYEYNVESPEVAKQNTQKYAGRVNGGDFQWKFNNEVDDPKYDVDAKLKDALVKYDDSIVADFLDNQSSSTPDTPTTPENPGDTDEPTTPENPGESEENTPVITGGVSHNFTTDGKNSEVFTITGNTSTSKGTVTYNGLTLTTCLKMESSTSISFTLDTEKTLTLVFGSSEASKKVKIDGTDYTTDSSGILTMSLKAGSHTITKGDSINLFYIVLA